jgi:hypothetical protein
MFATGEIMVGLTVLIRLVLLEKHFEGRHFEGYGRLRGQALMLGRVLRLAMAFILRRGFGVAGDHFGSCCVGAAFQGRRPGSAAWGGVSWKIQHSADRGNALGRGIYGFLWPVGRGLAKDESSVLKYVEFSADHGNPMVQLRYCELPETRNRNSEKWGLGCWIRPEIDCEGKRFQPMLVWVMRVSL